MRNRTQLPKSERKLDWVSDEEIKLALSTAVNHSYSLNNEDAISIALDMLGFSRATETAKKRIGELIQNLLEATILRVERDRLVLGEPSSE